jgi:hypothetical protein
MKKIIAAATLSVILSSAYADDYNYGSESSQNDSSYGSDSSQSSGYKSTSGTRYQYDMSDPSDSSEYTMDVDAQIRDKLSVDPSRSLDQGFGENGGGIYDD